MSAAKILRYDWADLTGQDELDSGEIEAIRQTLRSAMATPCLTQGFFLSLLNVHSAYLLSKPTSDFAVCLYRLFEQDGVDKSLRFLLGTEESEAMSVQQLMDLVQESFVFRKRPIPIISGIPPRIHS